MADAPLYSIGDTLYLKESASLGFLEAFTVLSIEHTTDNRILYNMSGVAKSPVASNTASAMTSGRRISQIVFYEDELCVLCDALALCRINLEAQLARIIALQSQHGCIVGTDG